ALPAAAQRDPARRRAAPLSARSARVSDEGAMRSVALAVVAAAAAALAAAAAPVAVREQLLAYEAPDGIHIVALDGSGDRLLPGTAPGDQNPEWSPQGDRVVLWTDADGAGDVVVIDAD